MFIYAFQSILLIIIEELMYTPINDKYDTTQWRGYEDDKSVYTNVHHKSYSLNKSTQIASSPYKSMAVSKLQVVRRTIDEVIVDCEEKRDMNDQAIRQVRSVNSEIIDDYRRYHPSSYKSNIHQASTAYALDYSQNDDLRGSSQLSDSLTLRARLNEELRKNNEVIFKLSKAKEQNNYLKSRCHNTFENGLQNQKLLSENQYLRYQISSVNQIPQEIFTEIEQLRRQNKALRENANRLFKKVQNLI